METSAVLILLTIVIGLVIAFLFLKSNSSSGLQGILPSSGSTLALVGEMGAGKTTLFELLKTGRVPKTVHSLAVNQADLNLTKLGLDSTYHVVDIPGHGSFRSEYEKHFSKSRAVVFFVDAQNDLRLADASHHLYTVLTSRALVKRRVPVVIACNKSEDGTGALSTARIRSILETGLEKLRKSRGTGEEIIAAAGRRSQLDEDDEGGPAPTLGKPLVGPGASSAPFVFEDSACPVSFAAISVKAGNLTQLSEALQKALAK